jgi:hypothetical protein
LACLIAVAFLVIAFTFPSGACAYTTAQLTEINNDAAFICASQLTSGTYSGMIAMTTYANSGGSLWFCGYFANYAALGLLRAYQATGNTTYLTAVTNYIAQYENLMNTNGTVDDWGGTWANPTNDGTMDSTDAYAGTFLMLCYAYYQVTGNNTWLSANYSYFQMAYNAMMLTWNSDGLTWALPTYDIKYLEDNLEVREGLRAIKAIATALGKTSDANTYNSKLTTELSGLQGMYSSTDKYFGWYKGTSTVQYDWLAYANSTSYAGQANAFALAYLLKPGNTTCQNLMSSIWSSFGNQGDYFEFAALYKFGNSNASAVHNSMVLTYVEDYGDDIRCVTAGGANPDYDTFIYYTEEDPLPTL